MTEYPTISVGQLRAQLALYPDDYALDFCGLEFYRIKERGPQHLQLEFNQPVYLDGEGRVVAQNLD